MFFRLSCFGGVHGNQLCRQHVHPGHPQQAAVRHESVQGLRREGKEHHGVVRGGQTAPAVQRERRDCQLRAHPRQCQRPQRRGH